MKGRKERKSITDREKDTRHLKNVLQKIKHMSKKQSTLCQKSKEKRMGTEYS